MRYTVRVRPRFLDTLVDHFHTDDIDEAVVKADEAHNAGNYSAQVWDNELENWVAETDRFSD